MASHRNFRVLTKVKKDGQCVSVTFVPILARSKDMASEKALTLLDMDFIDSAEVISIDEVV